MQSPRQKAQLYETQPVFTRPCPLIDNVVNKTYIGVHRSQWLIIPHKVQEHTKLTAGVTPVQITVCYAVITVTATDITAYTGVKKTKALLVWHVRSGKPRSAGSVMRITGYLYKTNPTDNNTLTIVIQLQRQFFVVSFLRIKRTEIITFNAHSI